MKTLVAGALALALSLGGSALAADATHAGLAGTAKHGLVDINRASEADLEHLSGIGPVMAKKMIQGRPYKSKDELVRRKVIPKSAYLPIKDEVVAHHI
jgi:DNA uptake protein ComE-like DNA-binding protein